MYQRTLWNSEITELDVPWPVLFLSGRRKNFVSSPPCTVGGRRFPDCCCCCWGLRKSLKNTEISLVYCTKGKIGNVCVCVCNITCKVVRLMRPCDQQCEDFHTRNSWRRADRHPTNHFHPVGSSASREPIAASDSAADADCKNKQTNENELIQIPIKI